MSSSDLIYSMVTTINNTVYLKFAKIIDLKCSNHRKYFKYGGDGCVDCGDYFTMYTYIKSSSCTP